MTDSRERPTHFIETPSPERFEEWVGMCEEGYLGGAYAFVKRPPEKLPPLSESFELESEERERVLLILTRGSTKWGVPGGGQEDEETLETTVRREVREEVGLDVIVTGLAHLRHEIATCEGYDHRLHAVRVFFEAEYEGGSLAIQPGELNGAVWFAEPPPEDRLLPATKRLLDGWLPG